MSLITSRDLYRGCAAIISRYHNVHRCALMLEHSFKHALSAVVFEPNDANSQRWIQGMLKNFLTLCWRQGALQGIKPEHAFFVRMGLGQPNLFY